MKEYVKLTIKEFLNENVKSIITLYHGTCKENGIELIDNGWQPNKVGYGANKGNPKYLYLTSHIEDAMWFAEENGCSTVVEVSDIPIEYLNPDPEDEYGYTMDELLKRIQRFDIPSKFVLIHPLDKLHFSIIN